MSIRNPKREELRRLESKTPDPQLICHFGVGRIMAPYGASAVASQPGGCSFRAQQDVVLPNPA